MTTSTDTTYFVGTHYEVVDDGTTQKIIKYYYAGSQRIAMRTDGVLNFILGDHLGSTSLVTDTSGVIVSQQYYKAWGETRYVSGTEQTKYGYTGQYSYVTDFGLHFYNARWYDSSLSRFAQADSIMPGGMQGLDRYAYVENSPIRYIDPSGHRPCGDEYGCEEIKQKSKNEGCSVLSGAFNGSFTCTPSNLDKASIKQRQSWFRGMLNYVDPNLVPEFSNINGILATFQATGTGAPGTWASWGDAGILVSIQNGLYMSVEGNDTPISMSPYGVKADTAWKNYFDSFRKDPNSIRTDQLWGIAEGAGTTYDMWLAQQHNQTRTTEEMLFLGIGNVYRMGLANKRDTKVNNWLWPVATPYNWFFNPSSIIPVVDIPPVSLVAYFLLQK